LLYSKPKNFLFLRVPKTASTSINAQILDRLTERDITIQTSISYEDMKIPSINSFNDVSNYHPTLKELITFDIIKEEDLSKLNIYAVIREPIDRIISCAHHFCAEHPHAKFVLKLNKSTNILPNDLVVEALFNFSDLDESLDLSKPQVDWLVYKNYIVNKLFKYNDIDKMIKEICCDESLKYNFRSKYRNDKSQSLSFELQQECRKRYPEDFAMWESL